MLLTEEGGCLTSDLTLALFGMKVLLRNGSMLVHPYSNQLVCSDSKISSSSVPKTL